MAYVKQDWVDRPSKTTPINAARLNHMEKGFLPLAKTSMKTALTSDEKQTRHRE